MFHPVPPNTGLEGSLQPVNAIESPQISLTMTWEKTGLLRRPLLWLAIQEKRIDSLAIDDSSMNANILIQH